MQANQKEQDHSEKRVDYYQHYDRSQAQPLRNLLFEPDSTRQSFNMIVADMDLYFNQDIRQQLIGKLKTAEFGYCLATKSWTTAIQKHIKNQYGCDIEPWQLYDVSGLANYFVIFMEMFTKVNDAIAFVTPCYYKFIDLALKNGRKTVQARLKLQNLKFSLDLESIEKVLQQPDVKALVFVHPTNPCGKVFSIQEMNKIAQLVIKYDKMLLVDEIFADQASELQFRSFLSLAHMLKSKLVVCNSPSKTYNCSGCTTGFVVYQDQKHIEMHRHVTFMKFATFSNVLSQLILEACYQSKNSWRQETNKYFKQNYEFLKKRLKQCLPQLEVYEMHCSFLPLVDFKNFGLSGKDIQNKLHKANIALNWTKSFFVNEDDNCTLFRLNIACNRQYLDRFVERLGQIVWK